MRNQKNELNIKSHQQNVIMATAASTTGINNNQRLTQKYGSAFSRIEIINKLQKQSKFTIWWFIVFYLLGAVCLIWDFAGAWCNVLDLYFVMINAYLIAKGKILGIYLAIVECLLYALISLRVQLYGEIVKVLFISIPLYIYSIVLWRKSINKQRQNGKTQKEKDDVVIKKLSHKQRIMTIFILAGISVMCYFFLKYVLSQTTALILSAISLAIMIVGKFLTAKQYIENYIVYVFNGVIGLSLWIEIILVSGFSVASLSMIIYRIALIFNDVYAYGNWNVMYKKIAINHTGFIFKKRKLKINKIIKLRRQYKNLRWNRAIDIAKNS